MKPIFILTLLFAALTACSGESSPASNGSDSLATAIPEGEKLMQQYCQACHALPRIEELDQRTWKNTVMVRMGAYLGVFWDGVQYYDSLPAKWLEPGEGGERVLNAGIYPAKPVISRDDFQKIVAYISERAPQQLNGPAGQYTIAPSASQFEAIRFPGGQYAPAVTSVKIDAAHHRVLAGFVEEGVLMFDASGKKQGSIRGAKFPVQIAISDNNCWITDIGSFKGIDNPVGQVLIASDYAAFARGSFNASLKGLQRPVHLSFADLDNDGQEDRILCEFGNLLGTLAWYQKTAGGWEKHLLLDSDGAIAAHAQDMNGDGLKDIVTLMANADEGLDIYVNEGAGKFRRERIIRFSPTWGSTAFEVVDFDKDGDADVLVANGDNADFKPVLKPHHGIRLYLNEGNFKFKEAFYLPLSGAYGLRARDFDLDGDLDIAAVSFYPDYIHRQTDAFVLFTQAGKFSFTASTVPEFNLSRWMVMDAADVDGDGDEDIVLGALDVKSSDASEEIYNGWLKNNVPVLLLRNKAK